MATVPENPKPGSFWIKEASELRFLYVAQDGNHAIRVAIRKDTGKVLAVDLEGYIHGECLELKIESTPEQKQTNEP